MLFLRALVAAVLFSCCLNAADTDFNWREVHSGDGLLWGIARGPAGVVAVGTGGKILVSNDSVTWTPVASGTTDWLVDVTYAGSRYYAVGENGTILVSTDARSWTRLAEVPTRQRLNAIQYVGDTWAIRYLAVGEGGTILTSPDGLRWTLVPSGTTRWLRGIAGYYSMGWIIVGEAGTLLASSNLTDWRAMSSGTTEDLESTRFNTGFTGTSKGQPFSYGYANFIAVGANGTEISINYSYGVLVGTPRLFTPAGAITRREGNLPAGVRFRQILPGVDGRLFVVGDDGAVYSNFVFGTTPWVKMDVGSRKTFLGGTGTPQGIYLVGAEGAIVRGALPRPSRLRNLSTRGTVAGGGFIAGTVVPAPGKRLLVRAVGPGLRGFGVTSTLSDPTLAIYDGRGRMVFQGSGLGSGADLTAVQQAATEVGAFPLVMDAGDTARVVTLAPGDYTFHVTSRTGQSGETLLEIYDLEGDSTPTLVNLSTRATAGRTQPVTAGFVVDGGTSKTLLVRAVGPGLAAFGVTNTVVDPTVEVRAGPGFGTYVGGNDDWGAASYSLIESTPSTLRATEIGIEAFALPEGSKDAAVLISVPPGAYTATANVKEEGTAGTVLIEVYEVPF